MSPTQGRTVIVQGLGVASNGINTQAAVVTRMWSPTMVNLMVLPDAGVPYALTSVVFCQDETEAAEAVNHGTTTVAYFPTKVP